MLSPLKLLFVTAVSFVFGAGMLIAWIPRFVVSGAPIVTGHIVARTPITEWGVPRADFEIAIPGEPVTVHSTTGRYLLRRIPVEVRFRYSGDPSRPVYLFEHEENPLWIGLFCCGVSLLLGGGLFFLWRASRTMDLPPEEKPTPV